MFFYQLLGVLLLICVAVELYARKDPNSHRMESIPGFKSFQITYLVVYLINMGADWLQGPYVYALYDSYGYKKDDIAILFLCGFFSSMVFGTFVGGIADKFGRKNLAIIFGLTYGLSCITKLSPDFYILLFGRVLGGIATSLLYSVFEAWMVFEHFKLGFSNDALSETFSFATFGNGCVAIASSLAASQVADRYGFVAPFMLSLALLMIGCVVVFFYWTENYGDSKIEVSETFSNAFNVIKTDRKILILGLIQSLYEASMYTFVFMWTPALSEGSDNSPLPFGIIFACYMVAIMIGSSLFKIIMMKWHTPHEKLAQYIFATAAITLSVPIFTNSRPVIAIAFCIFEVTCGMYWPCLGTIRGKYIPESSRSAVMNFFRIPLNLLVVMVLIKVKSFANGTVFMIVTSWLLLGLVMANRTFSRTVTSLG